MLSPSKTWQKWPCLISLISKAETIVLLPDPDKPVNHNTLDLCFRSASFESLVTKWPKIG